LALEKHDCDSEALGKVIPIGSTVLLPQPAQDGQCLIKKRLRMLYILFV